MSVRSKLASRPVWFLLATTLGGSCMFSDLEDDLDALERYGRIEVDFRSSTSSDSPKVIILMDAEFERPRALRVAVTYEPRKLLWTCEPGEYYVVAYEDRNENFRRDSGELAMFWGDPTKISVEHDSGVHHVSLLLDESLDPLSPAELQLVNEAKSSYPEQPLENIGVTVDLEDARFDPGKGELGMWEPREFLKEGLHGLYLLEEYDPNRVPIVLVHGVGGTSRDFESMVSSLDRDRYQAWVYCYPSGLALSGNAEYLVSSLEVLVAMKRPERVALVAHSMGGLVARAAAERIVAQGNELGLSLLVTLASPLSGVPSASGGVEWAPTVMPCWYDLSPGSPFLQQLFTESLEPGVPHFLFFAYKRSGLGGESSDGTIDLKSQLRVNAQAMARRVIGVDADHVGVLSDQVTLEELSGILDEHLWGAPR
jgi:pimeloyl-ACP methyl ester carboxylesterase